MPKLPPYPERECLGCSALTLGVVNFEWYADWRGNDAHIRPAESFSFPFCDKCTEEMKWLSASGTSVSTRGEA
jgi:hypothetical protein